MSWSGPQGHMQTGSGTRMEAVTSDADEVQTKFCQIRRVLQLCSGTGAGSQVLQTFQTLQALQILQNLQILQDLQALQTQFKFSFLNPNCWMSKGGRNQAVD